ncbi:Hypothetical predicted protein [Podarcis lilfordi]|uniref:Uncharacterized protein n=1 Tax=Podarcis lilfordi TaxID=74358 RepID=A0AA35K5H4_9SAUR|nr:Hypothetical predicted protein [Podarcis lilfordi]
MFLRSLSGVPRCVSGAALRLEFAQPSIVRRAWSRAISYTFHLLASDARIRGGFSNLILRDIHNSPWKTTINLKFRSLLNLNCKTVLNLECISPVALPLIKKKLQQLDFSNTASCARGPCSGLALAIPPLKGSLYTASQFLRRLSEGPLPVPVSTVSLQQFCRVVIPEFPSQTEHAPVMTRPWRLWNM